MPHSHIDETRLGPVAAAFLSVVGARWPDLLLHAVEEEGSLVFTVPAPMGSAVLWIAADIDFDEVIIGFGGGHSHGGPWQAGEAADGDFHRTIAFLDDIFAERVVGCRFEDGGGALCSLDVARASPWWAHVRAVRSWRGRHDRS
jgi:hypothetical protein